MYTNQFSILDHLFCIIIHSTTVIARKHVIHLSGEEVILKT